MFFKINLPKLLQKVKLSIGKLHSCSNQYYYYGFKGSSFFFFSENSGIKEQLINRIIGV